MGWKWKTVRLHLVLMHSYLKCRAYQNSEISYTMTSDSICLTCKYTGNGSVNATSWFYGSSDIPLTIQTDSCSAVSNKSSFETPRIQDIRCNSSTNIYNLIISGVQSTGYDETFACMFLDPDPGEPKAVVTIPKKDVPEVPFNVTITDVKQTSLTIQWVAGYNGGLEQTFHIIITTSDATRSFHAPDPGNGKIGTYILEDLMPNTEYSIYMSANNSMGSSNVTNVINQTTLKGNSGDKVGDGGSSSQVNIVIIVGVAVLVFGAVVCFVIWWKKCKKNTGNYKIDSPKKKHSSVPECSYQGLNKTSGQESSVQEGIQNYHDINKGYHILTGKDQKGESSFHTAQEHLELQRNLLDYQDQTV